MAGPVRESDELEQLAHATLTLRAGDSVERHRQRDVLGRGQIGQEIPRRLLPDEADHLAAVPAFGVSTPPRMFWSVDLPLPDAPTTAISSPGSTTRSRPWSATTSRSA